MQHLAWLCSCGATPTRYPNALRRSQTSDKPLAAGTPIKVPLLVIIFTEERNHARRERQRSTWLQQRWPRGELRASSAAGGKEPSHTGWRYVYVMARSSAGSGSTTAVLDRVQGDAVTLSAVRESYANLVYKTLEAVRWSLRHVAFGALLKTDDDSIVHVGRAAAWLHAHGSRTQRWSTSRTPIAAMYAGRVFNDSQVIRANYTRAELLHPEWYPPDFVKWAVPYESYHCKVPHSLATPCYYPPYCSGGGYIVGADAARRLVDAHDVRARAGRHPPRVEDAYIGILASESGVRPIDLSELVQDPPAGRTQEPSLFGGQILVHRVTDFPAAFKWLTFPVKAAGAHVEKRRKKSGKRRRRTKK